MVLHQEVGPPVAMQSGRVARRDGEYRRCGTANGFCGVQPKAGRHFSKVTHDRSSPQFSDYLLDIAASYPEADTIHLVMELSCGRKLGRGTGASIATVSPSSGPLLASRLATSLATKLRGHGTSSNHDRSCDRRCIGSDSVPDFTRRHCHRVHVARTNPIVPIRSINSPSFLLRRVGTNPAQ
jgi:hypothetical protein